LKIAEEAHILWLLYPQLRLRINFDENVLGCVLGDILFTNSCGHPAHAPRPGAVRHKWHLLSKQEIVRSYPRVSAGSSCHARTEIEITEEKSASFNFISAISMQQFYSVQAKSIRFVSI
jgi:hypothetical protein